MKRTIKSTVVLFLLIAAWAPRAIAGGPDQSAIDDLFREGNELFTRANEQVMTDPELARDSYRKAAMRFERIVNEGGIENGRLYYNIGNAYFRMKDIGRAILNYRRAERYIPNDPNLHQNLEYARARRTDRIEETERSKMLRTLFFWHYDLSTLNRAAAFCVFFFVFWLAVSVRLFFRRDSITWTAGIAGFLAILFAISLAVEASVLRTVRPGVVIDSEVVARKGNSTTYEQSFKDPLRAGTEFLLIEDRGPWYHVELADKRKCWLPSTSVDLVRQKRP